MTENVCEKATVNSEPSVCRRAGDRLPARARTQSGEGAVFLAYSSQRFPADGRAV